MPDPVDDAAVEADEAVRLLLDEREDARRLITGLHEDLAEARASLERMTRDRDGWHRTADRIARDCDDAVARAEEAERERDELRSQRPPAG